MIEAIIFNLDGTLVNTEKLEVLSYAQAAVELGGGLFNEQAVVEAVKEVAGFSRMEIVRYLLQRFDIESAATERMDAYNVRRPWQAFVQIRTKIYTGMLEDPLVIVRQRCPYSLDLLIWARENGFKTGLVTSSGCARTNRILQILDISGDFDFIATRDDVNRDKPDPEIYRLAAHELCIDPSAGLAIESSPIGVVSATKAGMHCIAVITDLTDKQLGESGLPDQSLRVDNPADLKKEVKAFLSLA